MNEATVRIKINKLIEAAGWRFVADGDAPANICLEPNVTNRASDRDALAQNLLRTLNRHPIPIRAWTLRKQGFGWPAPCPLKSGTGSEPRCCPSCGPGMISAWEFEFSVSVSTQLAQTVQRQSLFPSH